MWTAGQVIGSLKSKTNRKGTAFKVPEEVDAMSHHELIVCLVSTILQFL